MREQILHLYEVSGEVYFPKTLGVMYVQYKSCKLSVVCVPFSQRTEIFLPREIQTGCGIHPVSYSMSTGRALSPGVNWLGLDTDYLPLSSAEVKDDSPSMPSRRLQGQLYILPSTDPQPSF